MFRRSRTGVASLWVALAFAIEDTPNVVSAKIDAIKNAEILLNMVSPPQKELSLRGICNRTVWVDLKMRIEALRLDARQRAASWTMSSTTGVSRWDQEGRVIQTERVYPPRGRGCTDMSFVQWAHATRIARRRNTEQGVPARGEPV